MNFENYRTQLFGIAYRMLGSVMDAEDILQEAWMRYQALETSPEYPLAYLRKIVVNLSLDRLKSAKIQREQYIGEWLPEPIITSEDNAVDSLQRAESVSMALLIVLERLSPLERAVFILREVFDYEYAEIADTLERSESACRKLFSRAKKHIQAESPRFNISQETHNQIVNQFIEATQKGNIETLVNLLAEDAVLYSDGGGVVSAAIRPVYGRNNIYAFISGLYKKAQHQEHSFTIEKALLNGYEGMLMRNEAGQIIMAATFEVESTYITTIRLVVNPNKLSSLV